MEKYALPFVDFYVENKHTNKFKSFVAISIVIYTLILSIVSIRIDFTKSILQSTEVEILNTWNSYQNKIIKEIFYSVTIDSLDIDLSKVVFQDTRDFIQNKINSYKENIDKYTEESNENKNNLYKKIVDLEILREKIKIDINFLSYAYISQIVATITASICLMKEGTFKYSLYGISTGLTIFTLLLLLLLSI